MSIDLNTVYISCVCNKIVDYNQIEHNTLNNNRYASYKCSCNEVYEINESGEWVDEEQAKQAIVIYIIQNTIDVQNNDPIEL